jgi:hypothetical protein
MCESARGMEAGREREGEREGERKRDVIASTGAA